jgi:hypothetical protein
MCKQWKIILILILFLIALFLHDSKHENILEEDDEIKEGFTSRQRRNRRRRRRRRRIERQERQLNPWTRRFSNAWSNLWGYPSSYPTYARDCNALGPNECMQTSNCGWNVDPNYRGSCVAGDQNGPYFADSAQYYYNGGIGVPMAGGATANIMPQYNNNRDLYTRRLWSP